MRDNDSTQGTASGAGQIKPVDFVRTEFQLRPFDGFKPEEIEPKAAFVPMLDEVPAFRLAVPPDWAQNDKPCDGKWETYDEAGPGTGDPERAEFLCRGCPVRQECLDAALREEAGESGEGLGWRYRHGIRGGLTPFQRAALTSPDN